MASPVSLCNYTYQDIDVQTSPPPGLYALLVEGQVYETATVRSRSHVALVDAAPIRSPHGNHPGA